MTFRGVCLQVAVLAALLAALLAPIVTSAGTGIACDDFANPEAAQYLLDLDDSYAAELDPDGDGTACNDDEDAGEPLSEEEYIDAVWDEVDIQVDTVMDFLDTLAGAVEGDLSASETAAAFETLNDTAAGWVAYPDDAPVFTAPAGQDAIAALYDTWIGTIGDLGTTWERYLGEGIPPAGETQDEALEEFGAALNAFSTTSDDLIETLAAAEEDLPASSGHAVASMRPELAATSETSRA